MHPKDRIILIMLQDKIKNNPDMAEQLGIEIASPKTNEHSIIKNNERKEDNHGIS